jgi:hypothetical protein
LSLMVAARSMCAAGQALPLLASSFKALETAGLTTDSAGQVFEKCREAGRALASIHRGVGNLLWLLPAVQLPGTAATRSSN